MEQITQNILKPTFKGVAGRKEYWLTILFINIYTIIIGIISLLLFSIIINIGQDLLTSIFFIIGSIILLIISLWSAASILGIIGRRLHDIGLSAWWIILIFLTSTIGMIILGLIPTDSNSEYRE